MNNYSYLIPKDTSAIQRNCSKVILMYGDFLQSSKEEETYRRQKERAVFPFMIIFNQILFFKLVK